MCPRHWRLVPRYLQARVWRTYREGQCDDWDPSDDYCRAARAAVVAVAEIEDLTPDTTLYDFYLREADPDPPKQGNLLD